MRCTGKAHRLQYVCNAAVGYFCNLQCRCPQLSCSAWLCLSPGRTEMADQLKSVDMLQIEESDGLPSSGSMHDSFTNHHGPTGAKRFEQYGVSVSPYAIASRVRGPRQHVVCGGAAADTLVVHQCVRLHVSNKRCGNKLCIALVRAIRRRHASWRRRSTAWWGLAGSSCWTGTPTQENSWRHSCSEVCMLPCSARFIGVHLCACHRLCMARHCET